MSEMGRYCKAYPIERLQDFGDWEKNYRRESGKEEQPESGNGASGNGASKHDEQATENDYLFLQENFTVTKGIFFDEDVVFDNITPQWIDFCKHTLNFEVPADVGDAGEEEATAAAAGGNNGEP
jgi:hypothetical protein